MKYVTTWMTLESIEPVNKGHMLYGDSIYVKWPEETESRYDCRVLERVREA